MSPVELNVETGPTGYRNFILQLRRLLRTKRESFGVPHLVTQEEIPTPALLFDCALRTNTPNRAVTFKLRRDNLYLIGYHQVEGGQWMEFPNDRNVHLIPNSNFLPFGDTYAKLEKAGNREVEGTEVSSSSLRSVVDDLASKTTGNQTRARRLIIVIVMICEAIRLNPILECMVAAISTPNVKIERWMMDAIHNWGNYCEQVCRKDADPDYRLRASDLRLPPDKWKLATVLDASKILGMTLQYCFKKTNSLIGSHMSTTILNDYADGQEICFPGLPLVEVLSVSIDSISSPNPGQLYGTITVNDGLTQNIYNRAKNNPESIKPGQNVTLTGPHDSIWALRSFAIKFLLKNNKSDEEIINDTISWNAFTLGAKYDQLISQKLTGKRGAATANYAVLRNGVAATVTIVLEKGGQSSVQVYGQVAANFSNWIDPHTTSLLFNRPKEDSITVRQGQTIPLSKSVVAVSLQSSLKITANLYDKIAIGNVEFKAQSSGTSSNRINGQNGNWVTVKVSWGNIV